MALAIETLRPGDHTALIYRTRAEQFATLCPFIQSGLARRERCLYITNDTSIGVVRERLLKSGIDVAAAESRGALKIATKDDTYQKHGAFEPDKMVADLKAELQDSLRRGFTGLRATGEMTWTLASPDSLSQLIAYEATLHKQFSPFLTGLCQYDETRFEPAILSDIIRIHPKVIVHSKIYQHDYLTPPDRVLAGSLPQIAVSQLTAQAF